MNTESSNRGDSEVTSSEVTADSGVAIQVADQSLAFRPILVEDKTPTGAQLASAAGVTNVNEAIVLSIQDDGSLEDISPLEVVDLEKGTKRFIVVESDRTYRLTLGGTRLEWPCRVLTGGQLRKLGSVPENAVIRLRLKDEPDRKIEDHDMVDLDDSGIESFYTKIQHWIVNVQGVKVKSETPSILALDAITQAGFDGSAEWQIFLKLKGQRKESISLDTLVDLTRPGIEKIRLSPKEVNNGEVSIPLRREFCLLEADETYLDQNGFVWETVVERKRRWLLVHDYMLPGGFTETSVTMAMDIPSTYPKAQIDMFYTDPPLVLSSGRAIPATQVRATINGKVFHGWSRHRGAKSKWNPGVDSVITHLALIEGALLKEVEA